ncbi:MAG: SUMF1/EgtB/PvdO family nonheme iron enzyme [Anaerolineales bacterium]|nr:SUMF1/EgtB/PvdO family nonheme iron enzyme [Anaerolineales bacterium]
MRSLKYSPDSFSVSSRRKNNLRLFRFGGGVLVVLIILGFGLNFLMKNKPATTVPASVTSESPANVMSTSTSAPIVATATAFPQSTPTNAPTETPLVTPTLGVSSTLTGNDGAILVYIPEGEFAMGSDLAPDEQPVHQVALDAYWIDQTEVTNAMYEKNVWMRKSAGRQCLSHPIHANYIFIIPILEIIPLF